MYYNPSDEGKTHINVYSKSLTDLGRMLSNFYHFPFDIDGYGHFECVEAFWYYLGLKNPDKDGDILRNVWGYEAKKIGEELYKAGKDGLKEEHMEELILSAIDMKFQAKKHLLLPKYYDLPIVHYYNYNGRVIDVTDKFRWYVDGITYIRDSIVEHL